jgi:hypothetical protein
VEKYLTNVGAGCLKNFITGGLFPDFAGALLALPFVS